MGTSGISMTLFTNAREIEGVTKHGAKELRGVVERTDYMPLQIAVAIEACTIIDYEVRVDATRAERDIHAASAAMGEQMGAAMGAELEKVFKALEG